MPPSPARALPALLALAFASCTSSPHAPPGALLTVDGDQRRYGPVVRHDGSLTIPMVRSDDGIGEFFVYVVVGTSRGWWQVDTGAPFCAVNTRIARHEGFRTLTAGEIVTAAGTTDAQLGTLPSVRLGPLEIREVTALSLDDRYLDDVRINHRRGHVFGVLGADLLDHLGATIDFKANVIRLRHP